MNLIRRGEAVKALTDIQESMVRDLEARDIEGRPIAEKDCAFIRGVASGLGMAADAIESLQPVNLFAGAGILN